MTTTVRPPASPFPSIDEPAAVDDAERARRIRVAVRARSQELRQRHPILRHQDAIGAGVLAASALGVIVTAALYVTGHLAWYLTIPLAAFFLSFAHEIEHDQIHRLYFARNARAQHLMFAVCWALRPYTINPWARKPLHLLHHKVSGTEGDIEERAITNGESWGIKRTVTMIDPLVASIVHLPTDPSYRRIYLRYVAKGYFPLTFVALAIWYSFVLVNLANLIGRAVGTDGVVTAGIPLTVLGVVNTLAIVWIAPNVLRVACLHFVSSNMHYFGDVEAGNVIQQTQVLNRWFLVPVHLFCANFGSTHGIHHFVPSDPFYVRQLTARAGHRAMRENGVRFNDFGTFRRANRYSIAAD